MGTTAKQLILLLLFASPLMAQQYKFDVRVYGQAACDGLTDDTAAIQRTINAAAAFLQAGGSPGPIHFPPSGGACKVNTLTRPNVDKGWLVAIFDSALSANKIILGSYNAYIGRGSNFLGLSGAFIPSPTSTWEQRRSSANKTAFVDFSGVSNVYLEGISIQVKQRACNPPCTCILTALDVAA